MCESVRYTQRLLFRLLHTYNGEGLCTVLVNGGGGRRVEGAEGQARGVGRQPRKGGALKRRKVSKTKVRRGVRFAGGGTPK